jgi:RNA polymerase sigma factor (sigma-70 family)
MSVSEDNKLIIGILENNNRILLKIYDECYPMVEKMVINTGGMPENAQDIFQDAMIVAYNRIVSGKFELTCKLSTYLYAVSKRLWIQEKRKNTRRRLSIDQAPDIVEEPANYEIQSSNLTEIISRHFMELSKDCQKILKMHLNKVNISKIQNVMGYDTAHYAMDRKYRCKKSLIKRIVNDPKFKSIKNEYSGEIRPLH